ncbi:CvpA family protein [Piscinibacter koreensis]|uniref:CvpA family protein n=1 Tax=Piscinibacter koreensis TaxID=2742824 RepID=A0A7Y6TVN2_9BURK|nr:CvpA family protein [Schlegelella koreensis]NUZ05193.1 CvpA family protein [Schlegelella koreensis]
MPDSIGGVDLCLIGVLVLSMLVGAVRGLVYELLGLAGWVVAYVAARMLAPLLAPHMGLTGLGSAANSAAAFVLAFVGVLIAWGLLAKLIRAIIHATPLRPGDRVLGAGFGVLRGVVVLLALVAAIGLTPIAGAAPWRASTGVDALTRVLQRLGPLLPGYLSPWIASPPAT